MYFWKNIFLMTRSEENYIKTIYHLGGGGSKSISTNAIAEQMDTKPSSVTDMAKKLAEKGLVDYVKYQGVSLSDFGVKTAPNRTHEHSESIPNPSIRRMIFVSPH